jgi:hypothetical protein
MLDPAIHEQDDSVNVIRHDHKRIERHLRKMLGDLMPTIFHYLTDPTVMDLFLNHLAEKGAPIIGADGHVVCSAA